VDSKALTADGIEAGSIGLAMEDQADSDEFKLLPAEVEHDSSAARNSVGSLTTLGGAGSQNANPASKTAWNTTGRASPIQDWTSESTSRKRQLLLLGIVGLTSLVLTGVLTVLFLRYAGWSGDAAVEVAKNVSPAAVEDDAAKRPAEADNRGLPEGLTGEQPALPKPDDLPNSGDPYAITIELDASDPNTPDSTAADSLASDESEKKLPERGSDLLNSGSADAATSSPSRPPDQGPSSVMETPSEASPIEDQISDSSQQENPLQALPSKLRELAELIGEPFEFSVPQALVVPEQAPVTAEELGLSAITADKSLPAVDLHAASNERRIRAMKLDDVPLAHALNFLSLASGLPLILDANSLAAVNRSRSERIRLTLGDSTAAEATHKLAQQLELQLQSIENRYFRFYAKPPDEQQLPLEMSIGDLVDGDEGSQWLRSYVNQFFPDVAAGFTIENSMLLASRDTVDPLSRFMLFRSLENWRIQRGLPQVLQKYQAENLLSTLVTPSQMKRLDQPLQQVTTSPRPLASLLSSLGGELGIQCWCDWPALARLGLAPGSLVTVVTLNRSLKSVLQELAFEYNLVTVIVDENTLWLTNQETYRQSPQVFVLPNEDRTMDYWEQYFRPLTPVVQSGVSKSELLFSPDKKFVFVKCCLPTLQFN